MFEKLTINNYQSHDNTEIEFSEGVTGIFGLSQSGKTAILRALYWLAYNRPAGFRFLSHFAKGRKKETRVWLDVDGVRLVKVKTKGDSVYSISNERKSLGRWEKFGSLVPDEVVDLLNISDINLQKQLDAPFLITSPAGKISRTINKITKVEEADAAATLITRKANKVNASIAEIDEDISSLKVKKKKYKLLPEIDLAISESERLSAEAREIRKTIVEIDDLADEIESLYEEIDRQEIVLKADPIISGIDSIDEEIAELKKFKSRLNSVVNISVRVRESGKAYEAVLKRYKEALKAAKVCPICFRDITDETIETIIEDL